MLTKRDIENLRTAVQDDPEAFIDLFERTAEACRWPRSDWPVRLILMLLGEALVAAQQLPVQNLLVYEDLKRAILLRDGLSPEQQRQRFRPLDFGESGRPFVLAQQLRDSCRRWLLAGGSDIEKIIDQVVLEQFIARLPKKKNGAVGSVPPSDVAGPGHSTDRGPDGGVPRDQ